MNKKQFLRKLKKELRYLPQEEINASLKFYDEAICERMEHGLSETEATSAVGSPEEAAGRILAELPAEAVRQTERNRRFRYAIVIPAFIIGLPIWVSLLVAVVAVAISVAAVYYANVLTFFSTAFALIICVVPLAALIFISGSFVNGVACLSGALACAGLGILFILVGILLWKLGAICIRKIFSVMRRRAVVA